jgi:F-type H+-transporting ATPase subunit delta
MRNTTVARRYARALYQLAAENKNVDEVLQSLSNVCQAIQTAPEMKRLLLNPLIKPEIKQKLIGSISSNKLIGKFTGLLDRRKRLDLLPTIFELVTEMSDESLGVHRAVIKTAVPLSESQKKTVETDLAKRVGGKILGRFEVSKDLIGGIWVKMGDKVLDASLKGRIQDFRHALLNSAN